MGEALGTFHKGLHIPGNVDDLGEKLASGSAGGKVLMGQAAPKAGSMSIVSCRCHSSPTRCKVDHNLRASLCVRCGGARV